MSDARNLESNRAHTPQFSHRQTFRHSAEHDEMLERLVEEGSHANRCDAIRAAIEQLHDQEVAAEEVDDGGD